MIAREVIRIGFSRTEVWWCALGAGVVVIACVVVLLTLLAAFVRDIETRLRIARTAVAATSGQLSESSLIPEAAALIKDLAGQLELQRTAISSRGGQAK